MANVGASLTWKQCSSCRLHFSSEKGKRGNATLGIRESTNNKLASDEEDEEDSRKILLESFSFDVKVERPGKF